jgi:shikimate dehydrogenase
VGTFPNVEDCVSIPFEGIGENHLIIDLVYNPEYSKFIKKAAERGAKTVNGLYMLEQQAEKAWEIWNQ